MTQTNFEHFATSIVRKQIDPERLRIAKEWYRRFAGKHAVNMDDRDIIDIYDNLS
jgi:hypothetical protein